MWKNNRYKLINFILTVVLILTGLRAPVPVSAEATVDKTSTGAVVSHEAVIIQNGKKITDDDNSKIDILSELTLTITDKLKFDKTAPDHITNDSYIEYELGKPLKFHDGYEELIKADERSGEAIKGKVICKAILTSDSDGEAKVKFDFSFADPDMFNQDVVELKPVIKLKVIPDKILPSENNKIRLLDKSYEVDDKEDEIELTKSGELSSDKKSIEWTVNIKRKVKGSVDIQLSLKDFVFSDAIEKVGSYKTETFKINNASKADSDLELTDPRYIKYKIKDEDLTAGDKGKAEIKFSTNINNNHFLNGYEFKNNAELYRGEKKVGDSNEAKVKLNGFGGKRGTVNSDKSITWEVIFNEGNLPLGNVTIQDELKKSVLGNLLQTRHESYYQSWDEVANDWSVTSTITPDTDNNYNFTGVTKKMKLTIVTSPINLGSLAANKDYYEFKNEAVLSSSYLGYRIILPASIHLGDKKTEKTAVTTELLSEKEEGDRRKDADGISNPIKRVGFETEWKTKFSRVSVDSQTYYLYDVFIFDNDYKISSEAAVSDNYKVTGLNDTNETSLESHAGLNVVISDSNKPHQRLMNPENPLTENLSEIDYKVYAVRDSSNKHIGHILELKMAPEKGYEEGDKKIVNVKFKSKLVEPKQVISDGDNYASNYLSLFSDSGNLMEENAAVARYNTKMAKKQVLSKEASESFVKNLKVDATNNILNDDIFDSSTELAKDNKKIAYSKKDKSLVYRLSVNAANITDVHGDLGDITFTDDLPEGFELVKITGDKDYLLYKGRPATGIERFDATVLAEGEPIDSTEARLTFKKDVANKLEFKFNKLSSPYVLLFKLRIKDSEFGKFLNKKSDVVNTVSVSPEKKSFDGNQQKEATSTAKCIAEVDEEFLGKTADALSEKFAEKGYIKWNIVYTPYKAYDTDVKVKLQDELNDAIMIRREKDSNTLVFQGDNFRIFEGRLDNGNFIEEYEITENKDKIFEYDKDTKKFTINLPDARETYKISYLTDFNKEISVNEVITNKVSLFENGVERELNKPVGKYTAKIGSSGRVWGFNKLTVIKKNKNGDKLLSGAKFELKKKEGTGTPSEKTTGTDGKAEFPHVSEGEYVLSETQPPANYKANPTLYKVKITHMEVGFRVELLETYTNVTQDDNELIITNEISDVSNLGKLKIVKTNADGTTKLFGAKFGLYKGGALISGESKTTDANGVIEYDGLEAGDYTLKELMPPTGYKLNTSVYNIKLQMTGSTMTTSLQGSYSDAEMTDGVLNVKNTAEDPSNLVSVKLIKKSTSGSLLPGAKFELRKNGDLVTAEPVITGGDGSYTFYGLTEGRYVLKEVMPPSGYKAEDAVYIIKITKTAGIFTVAVNETYPKAYVSGEKEITVFNEAAPSSYTPGGTPPYIIPTPPKKPGEPDKPQDSLKPDKPSKPDKPGKKDKPVTPGKTDKPEKDEPDKPVPPSVPSTQTPAIPVYRIDRTPDPNDPNSSDKIEVIGDDGHPLGKFEKRVKPNGDKEYVFVEDGTPLSHFKKHKKQLPNTGGSSGLWYLSFGISLVLAVIFIGRRRK